MHIIYKRRAGKWGKCFDLFNSFELPSQHFTDVSHFFLIMLTDLCNSIRWTFFALSSEYFSLQNYSSNAILSKQVQFNRKR